MDRAHVPVGEEAQGLDLFCLLLGEDLADKVYKIPGGELCTIVGVNDGVGGSGPGDRVNFRELVIDQDQFDAWYWCCQRLARKVVWRESQRGGEYSPGLK